MHGIGGGADRVYLNTAALLESNGHSVAYFSVESSKNRYTKFSTYFISYLNVRESNILYRFIYSFRYLYNFEAKKKLTQLLSDFKPDIAHLHLFYGTLSSSILSVFKNRGIPVVVTIHDYRLICPTSTFLDKKGNICERCLPEKPYNCFLTACSENSYTQSAILTLEAYLRHYLFKPKDLISWFIFVSRYSMAMHLKYNPKWENKSSVLYNFSSNKNSTISDRGDYLLYYGRLSFEKGLITLIDTILYSNYRLKIVGEGPLEKIISSYIKGHNNIDLVGFKEGNELVNYIKGASFVILPSEWYENNPMAIIESFSFGKPVIASEIGGIPELLDEKRGFLFKPRSKLHLKAAIDSAHKLSYKQYLAMCHECQKFILEKLNPSFYYDELISIYKRIST